ncbi:CFS1-like protein [Mycena chlorophos]|uniref:CFS1-like protein n=1 Tax=Mycena chlorophos TaxID=658473 RepID=A0A8H6SBN4_MYCCL|nr:CFS1-like protein [Mycena chlorophos]
MPTLYASQLLSTSTTHSRYSLFRVLDGAWAAFTESLTGAGMRTLYPLAKSSILTLLGRISSGRLTVYTSPTEPPLHFGACDAPEALRATLTVRSDAFWMRVALFTDLGLSEAFMFGDVDCDDVSALIQILIANRRVLTGADADGYLASILARGRALTNNRFIGSLANSKANISAHYDLGNTMCASSLFHLPPSRVISPAHLSRPASAMRFACERWTSGPDSLAACRQFSSFLSSDMNYSSAVFLDFNQDLDKRIAPEDRETLYDAQMRKLRLILGKANIQPGQRLLEIAALARERICAAGLASQITVHVMDFRQARDKPEWKGAFDRFVSVEMVEHVGKAFFEEYWAGITIPEGRVKGYEDSVDFIQKWIFPGGYLPNVTMMINTLTQGTEGRLLIDSVLNIGPHYARTLREWKARFLASWDGTVKKALREAYSLDEQGLEIFKRKWIYYFDYCEAGFKTRTLGDHILTFTREGNVEFGCDVDAQRI